MALTSLALSLFTPLAVAGPFELGDEGSLFELGDRTQHLPDQICSRRVLKEGIRAVGGYEVVAELAQQVEARLLHDKIAREAIGGLHDDGFDAVAFEAFQQIGEARPVLEAVRARDGLVVVSLDNLESGMFGERLNRRALALFGVLIGPDIGRRGRAQIRQSGGGFLTGLSHWSWRKNATIEEMTACSSYLVWCSSPWAYVARACAPQHNFVQCDKLIVALHNKPIYHLRKSRPAV